MRFTNDFQNEMKKIMKKGRCLSYKDGVRCNEIISAHTIQKSGQLQHIAEDGKVYRFIADLSILKKTDGKPAPKKIGINTISTFPGFCKHHDNELFKLIDTSPLLTHSAQIPLYAYRCLCKETFLKENAVTLWTKMIRHPEIGSNTKSIISAAIKGNQLAHNRILHHKKEYENSIKSESYDDFVYIVFNSQILIPIQVAGIFCPEYSFLGEKLQDLADPTKLLDCLTFFTAPSINGWSLCFAWHKSSNNSCNLFLRSLATLVYELNNLDDALLQFVFTCSENHAFKISWWDSLTADQKSKLSHLAAIGSNPFEPLSPHYLHGGLEGIQAWHFDSVRSTQDPTFTI